MRPFPPCGFVAGLYAATDATRGVWKAPAGIDASLTGESGLTTVLTDLQNGTLNIQAINCLRSFPVYGDVIWGARTLRGNDQVGSEWKYVPIRRLALFLESSLYDGTQWVVFEPNDERLWSQIRLNVGAFMQGLFLQGAFQGTTPQQAYFVKCDAENNPQSSIDLGNREHPGRLRAAVSGGVRRHPDPADGRSTASVRRQLVAQPFPVNPKRLDPYKNFKFRLKWDGQYVYGGSKLTGLKRTTEVVEHRNGGDPSTSHKSPGRTKYEAITLERGLTQDMAFHDWAGMVWNFGAGLGSEVSLANFRKDIYLEFYNEAGQLVIAYKIYRCWVSEYQAMPDLDANANAIAIEHLKLENEGFERDTSVTEPKEPTLSTVAT